MILQIQNNQRKHKVTPIKKLVRKAAEAVFSQEKLGKYLTDNEIVPVLSVTLADNRQIRQINQLHRKIDKETDVLSFPLIERNGKILDSVLPNEIFMNNKNKKELYLGDVVLSIEKAVDQSIEYGHSTSREIAFLTVHSVLHLLGYDHQDPTDERIMIQHQKNIMKKLRLPGDII